MCKFLYQPFKDNVSEANNNHEYRCTDHCARTATDYTVIGGKLRYSDRRLAGYLRLCMNHPPMMATMPTIRMGTMMAAAIAPTLTAKTNNAKLFCMLWSLANSVNRADSFETKRCNTTDPIDCSCVHMGFESLFTQLQVVYCYLTYVRQQLLQGRIQKSKLHVAASLSHSHALSSSSPLSSSAPETQPNQNHGDNNNTSRYKHYHLCEARADLLKNKIQ